MTIKELFDYTKHIVEGIPIVTSFYSGDNIYDIWNATDVKYGSFVISIKSVTVSNTIKYNCVVYYGDRLMENRSNRDSIHNDAVTIINNFVNILNNSDDVVGISYPIECQLFEQKFTDDLAGAWCNLTIETVDKSTCW